MERKNVGTDPGGFAAWSVTKFVTAALLMSMTSTALAGGDGGGGSAAVFRNSKHKVTGAKLIDLTEGHDRFHFDIPESPDTPEKQIINALAKIPDSKAIYGGIDVTPNFVRTLVTQAVVQVIRSMHFLPKGKGLAPTTDLGKAYGVIIPDGSNPEPVGYYESDGTLEVSRSVYKPFSKTHRAAFIMHEALCELARDTAAANDTADCRKANAALFARNVDVETLAKLLNKVIFPFSRLGVRAGLYWADPQQMSNAVILKDRPAFVSVKTISSAASNEERASITCVTDDYPAPLDQNTLSLADRKLGACHMFEVYRQMHQRGTSAEIQVYDDQGRVLYSGKFGDDPVYIPFAVVEAVIPKLPTL